MISIIAALRYHFLIKLQLWNKVSHQLFQMMVLDMQQKTVVDDITQFADHATEASLQRCFYKKVFWKYAENLQENTHADVDFSKNAKQLY